MGHTTRTPDHNHVPDLTQLVVDDETDGEAPCAICGALLVAEGPYSSDHEGFILLRGKLLLRIKGAEPEAAGRQFWAAQIAALLNFAHAPDDHEPDRAAIDPLGTTQVHP
jgi:hypothetical protein